MTIIVNMPQITQLLTTNFLLRLMRPANVSEMQQQCEIFSEMKTDKTRNAENASSRIKKIWKNS